MAKKPILPDHRDAEIERLSVALFFSRRAIVQLMPEKLRETLHAAWRCESQDDFEEWQAWAIDRILTLAESRPGDEMYSFAGTSRAYCPLCNDGASNTYARGFSMPTGLRRHLQGSHRSHRCDVFAAAVDSCLDDLATKAKPGYRGPNLSGFNLAPPPWKVIPPEPEPEPERPSAQVLKFPGA